jgi:hypothetical protein
MVGGSLFLLLLRRAASDTHRVSAGVCAVLTTATISDECNRTLGNQIRVRIMRNLESKCDASARVTFIEVTECQRFRASGYSRKILIQHYRTAKQRIKRTGTRRWNKDWTPGVSITDRS